MSAGNKWVRRVQKNERPVMQMLGWKLVKEPEMEILRCEGRVTNYQPIYVGVINKCNHCKLYLAKPYEAPTTAKMPSFRTNGNQPFEVTGVDIVCPLHYKIGKNEDGKCYVLIFTCAA